MNYGNVLNDMKKVQIWVFDGSEYISVLAGIHINCHLNILVRMTIEAWQYTCCINRFEDT